MTEVSGDALTAQLQATATAAEGARAAAADQVQDKAPEPLQGAQDGETAESGTDGR